MAPRWCHSKNTAPRVGREVIYLYEKVLAVKQQRYRTEGPSEANRLFQPSSRFLRNHAGWDSLDTALALARVGLGRLLPGGGISPSAPLLDAAGYNVNSSVLGLRSDPALPCFLAAQRCKTINTPLSASPAHQWRLCSGRFLVVLR